MGTYESTELLKKWERTPDPITNEQAIGQSLQLHVQHDERLEEHDLEFIRHQNKNSAQFEALTSRINQIRNKNRSQYRHIRTQLRELKGDRDDLKMRVEQIETQLTRFQEATEKRLGDLETRLKIVEAWSTPYAIPAEEILQRIERAFNLIVEATNQMTYALSLALRGEDRQPPPPQEPPTSSSAEEKSDT